MTLLHPIWLLAALPLFAALYVWRPATTRQLIFRIVIFVLLILSAAALQLTLRSRAGTLLVVADRSLSMPERVDQTHREVIDILRNAKPSTANLGVLSFGAEPGIEAPPGSPFSGFVTLLDRDASDLAAAIDRAVSLVPRDASGRVLLLTDGRWTGEDPRAAASRAASRGIAVDFRVVARPSANDVAITSVDVPEQVSPGEAFLVTLWIRSPVAQELVVELRRGKSRIGGGRLAVPAGASRATFRDRAGTGGTIEYTAVVGTPQKDPIPENNTARALVGVEGTRPILLVSGEGTSGLADVIRQGGSAVTSARPDEIDWTLAQLSGYSAVVLEDVAASRVGNEGMQNLAAWVEQSGRGLMITGGQSSFGPGGYFKSPLDPVIPVSMELRREHRKLSLAIVIAMDRSGSMAAPAGAGKTKMDLANLAAVQTLDLLSPIDEFGVVAVDSAAHVIADMKRVEEHSGVRNQILAVESMGGGIFVFEALATAAKMLLAAQSETKHIILFADAADAEEPGAYEALIEKCRKTNMTISVIGLGTPQDTDAKLLEDIARRGGGRIFFTTDPEELPRLFAQDTFVVARSTFIDEPTPMKLTAGMSTMSGVSFSPPPPLGGYNLCYLRDGANLGAVTVDEYKAPVVASWQAGLGRVVAYTGDADGKFTGPIAGWNDVGPFMSTLARWTAGEARGLSETMLVTQRLDKGLVRVEMQLDPERDTPALPATPTVRFLHGVAGQKPTVTQLPFRWTSADTLTATLPLSGNETVLPVVQLGDARKSLAPACLPYSPEYKPLDLDEGEPVLASLARITGGRERVKLDDLWNDLPKRERRIDLRPWLLTAALLLLLLEVFDRRIGWSVFARKRAAQPEPQLATVKRKWSWRRKPSPGPAPAASVDEPEPAVPETPPEPDLVDALRRARDRARERIE